MGEFLTFHFVLTDYSSTFLSFYASFSRENVFVGRLVLFRLEFVYFLKTHAHELRLCFCLT